MIRVRGLRKEYDGTAVLDGLDFRVQAGERVAVLGMNGAGKTTLFRALLSLTPFQGSVEIGGVDVADSGLAARTLTGYVPQRPPVSDMILRDFVTLHAGLRGVAVADVAAVLASLGFDLDRSGGKALTALSGGMLQKTLLALALAADVPLLLLDEATANLDPLARDDFLAALSTVDESTTVLLASHRLAEVEAVTDRVLVLHGGTLVFAGTMDELRRRTGAVGRIWIEVPVPDRSAARELLVGSPGVRDVRVNGRGLWVEVDPGGRGGVVSRLAEAGLTPGDVRTVDEPLNRMLARFQRPDPSAAAEADSAVEVDNGGPVASDGGGS